MNLSAVLTQSLAALGYELVDAKLSPQGLLRVFIDFAWEPEALPRHISVEDCEKVSRHLSFILPVENIDYARLEVSSPGLDRPLFTARDYQRFMGCEVSLKFRIATPQMGNRRKFQGILRSASNEPNAPNMSNAPKPAADRYQLMLTDEEYAIEFEISEVESARLVPQIPFKKR